MRFFSDLLDKFEAWLYNKEEITIQELKSRLNESPCEIYNNDELKFVSTYDTTGYYVSTPTGYRPVKQLLKTVPYTVHTLYLEDGKELSCADTHIVIDNNGNKKYVKVLTEHDIIQTEDGESQVKYICQSYKKEAMYDLELDDSDHVYYTNGILSHNTITAAAFILHYVIFNKEHSVAILANKFAMAREIFSRVRKMLEGLPFFLQPGVKEYNKSSIEFGNGSKIMASSTSSDSIRGFSFNLVLLDEAAFIPNMDEFFESTYPVISSGKKTKMIITSTANGFNLYYKMWSDAVAGNNTFYPNRVDWWENPNYDEEWKEETIKNIGQKRFDQEYGNSFFGSSNTLIDGNKLQQLVWEEPIKETFNFKLYEPAQKEHTYIITVDVAEGVFKDYSVCSVFDISEKPYKQVAVFRDNSVSLTLLSEVILSLAKQFNNAKVLIEVNSMGIVVAKDLFYVYEYENMITTQTKKTEVNISGGFKITDFGIKTTKKTKRIGANALKQLIENDILIIKDYDTIVEMQSFVQSGDSYEADKGKTDDLVMSCLLFAWLTTQEEFEDEFKLCTRKEILQKELDDYDMPFGFYNNPAQEAEDELLLSPPQFSIL